MKSLRQRNVYLNGSLLNYEDVIADNVSLFTTCCGGPIKFFVDVIPLNLRRDLEIFICSCGGDVVLDRWRITARTVLIGQTSNLQPFDRPVFSPQFIVDCLKNRELLNLKLYLQNCDASQDFVDIVFREKGSFLGVVHLQYPELEESVKAQSFRLVKSEIDTLRSLEDPIEFLSYTTADATSIHERVRQALELKSKKQRPPTRRSNRTHERPTLDFEQLVEEFELYLESKKEERLRQYLNVLEGHTSELIEIVQNQPIIKQKLLDFCNDDSSGFTVESL